ncbi:hypothetical protein BaRGS_00036107, partial [Batillaria attramentaria]
QEVPYQCAPPTNTSDFLIPELHNDWLNTSVHYGKCTITVTANASGDVRTTEYSCVYGMQYKRPEDASIVSEFDLVCGRSSLAALTQTLLSLGSGLGSVVCPTLSDLFGRKRVLVISQSLMFVASLVAGLAPNYIVFLVVKGVSLTAITAGLELFPSTHRFLANGFWETLWWAICLASLALLAYLLRFESWRVLQLSTCGAAALVVVMIVVLHEPLQWLIANNKEAEAEIIIQKAAKMNRKDVMKVLDAFHGLKSEQKGRENKALDTTDLAETAEGTDTTTDNTRENGDTTDSDKYDRTMGIKENVHDEEKLGFKKMFTHRRLRTNILVSWFIWFVDNWVYNALYLMSSQLAGSLHLNFFLNAAVEGASCIMILLLLERLGRKKLIAVFHFVAGLSLVASGVCFNFQDTYTSLKIVGTIFSLCGKMGISGSFNTIYLYTPEIFPTNIRNRALGTSMAVSTVGAMIAPFTDSLADYGIWITGVVFGLCSLLAMLLLLLLPESKGRDLPQTVKDLESWYDDPSKAERDVESTTKAPAADDYFKREQYSDSTRL